MDSMDMILTRRSIRKYTDQNISNDILFELINTAFSAPTAGNQQPWHFIIIDDKKILKKVTEFHPNSKMLLDAQKAILVCGDLDLEKFKGYWMLDCSAATENILLAARCKGIGSCWLGIYPREDRILHLRSLLNMPENIIPFSLISLGYPAEEFCKVNRYNKLRVHYNKW